MGQPLKDNIAIAFLLSSLPESYNSIVMSLESRPETDLTLSFVKEKLIQVFKRRKENSHVTNNHLTDMETSY